MDNIADCLYDHRLDSAKDLCKRISSPEARIIRKGLEKIDKSSLEMFVTIVNQREIETIQLRKDLFNGHFYHFLLFRRFFGLVR